MDDDDDELDDDDDELDELDDGGGRVYLTLMYGLVVLVTDSLAGITTVLLLTSRIPKFPPVGDCQY
jgi:hypothetical protein